MNCAEAVNPAVILWKPRQNKDVTEASNTPAKKWVIRVDPRKSVAKGLFLDRREAFIQNPHGLVHVRFRNIQRRRHADDIAVESAFANQ